MGSVGNFDKTLTIDEHGHVLPTGTLDVDEGHVVKKFYIWVFQMRSEDEGAVAAGFQDKDNLSASRAKWTSRSDVVHDGVFEEGLAIGMVLAVVEKIATETSPGINKVRWWSETIRLVKA